jgi:hypothetical protein
MRWVCSMLPPGEFHTVPVVGIGILEGGGEGGIRTPDPAFDRITA